MMNIDVPAGIVAPPLDTQLPMVAQGRVEAITSTNGLGMKLLDCASVYFSPVPEQRAEIAISPCMQF